MDNNDIDLAIEILKQEIRAWEEPIVGRVAREHDPFKVLVATLLSLRTKDSTTDEACERLFKFAATPIEMLRAEEEDIAKAIYPVGFYKTKARTLRQVSQIIEDKHHGQVPDTLEGLLALPGVGRKTANLVLILGFDKMGICVDTHVHRITNRWGYVQTKTADETEFALREILPERHWKIINDLLVPYGQNLCHPISPYCSRCKLTPYCRQIGVTKKR